MKKRRNIGLLCSVEKECAGISAIMQGKRSVSAGTASFLSGEVDNRKITLGVTGIGKVNAAHGCVVLINRYRPQYIINFGIGGCYPDDALSVGDVAVAEQEIYADEGVWGENGFGGMKEIGIALIESAREKIYNELPADEMLLNRFKKISWEIPFRIAYGKFLTVSSVSGSPGRSRELKKNFQGICENMEGAAIFHTAFMYGVPCLEMRGISNTAGMRNRKNWDIDRAAKNCQEVLLEFLRHMN